MSITLPLKAVQHLAKGRIPKDPRNGQEIEYEQLFLMGRAHGYEQIKLNIGQDAWYTPDYWVLGPDDVLEFHEVKGHWREAAKVRIRAAAKLYPWFRFRAAHYDRATKQWQIEHFGPSE